MARVTVLNGAADGPGSGGEQPLGCVICGINISPCWTHVCQLYFPCTDCGPDCNPVE